MHYIVFKKGLKNGISVIFKLSIVLVPINILVSLLHKSGWLTNLTGFLEPYMGLFGLPPESSIVMLLGWTINLYAAIGAAHALMLSNTQIVILGIMLGIAHSLPQEVAVIKQIGISVWRSLLIRLVLSLLAGFILNMMNSLIGKI